MRQYRSFLVLCLMVMALGMPAVHAATPQVADGDTVKGKIIRLHDGSSYQGESILGLVPHGQGELTRVGGRFLQHLR